jgi:hypothetical protein
VRLKLTDSAGNTATVTSGVATLDATAPGGGAPTVGGAATERTREVVFTRDPSAVHVGVELLDAAGTVVQTIPVASGGSATLTLPDVDGAYAVRVVQADAVGNVGRTPQTDIVLDRVAPVAGWAPAVSGSPDALLVTFDRAKDAATATIEVRDAAGTLVLSVAVADGDRATIDLPDAPGAYSIRVVQADAAGNHAKTPDASFTRTAKPTPVDPPAPVIEFPPAGEVEKPATGAVLAPSAKGRVVVNSTNELTLPLRCPAGQVCTVSGSLVLTASGRSAALAHAAAAERKVLARFSQIKVRGDKVRKLELRVPRSFVRSAQKAGKRKVRVTLTINTTLGDGTTTTKAQRLSLVIPRVKQAPTLRPSFTG